MAVSTAIYRDPGRQYVVAGGGPIWGPMDGLMAARVQDEVVRQQGHRVYELMNLDDAVAAALMFLKAGTLSEGIQLAPAVTVEAGQEVTDPELAAKLATADEVYQACQRVLDGLGDSIHATLFELLDGLWLGCKAAEQVFELATDGPDAGRQVPTHYGCVPNWSWLFRTTAYLKVTALNCWTADGWRDIEREHFTVFSWDPKDGDPRGSSIYRTAYRPWNRKWATDPSYGKYISKFGTPSVILEAGPDAQPQVATDPVTGEEREVTPQEVLLRAGLQFENGSVLALPNQAKAHILQSSGSGEIFDRVYDRSDREIFRAVILAARPMQEAKHGSKADTESGMDLFRFAVTQVRKPLVKAFRQDFLTRFVALNWGDRIARELTPRVSFGATEDVSPDLMRAFADAWGKGIFEDAQKPWIWGKLSAPTPTGWKPKKDDPERTGTKDTDGDGTPDPVDPDPGTGPDDDDTTDPADGGTNDQE